MVDDTSFQKIVNDMEDNLYKTAQFCQKRKSHVEPQKFSDETRSADEIDADITRSEHNKWSKIVASKDPRTLWKHIEWKGPKANFQMCTPSAKEFGEHFMQKSTIDNEEVLVLDSQGPYVPDLDDDVTLEEVEAAAKKLKEKSTSDGWTPKMITSISTVFYPLLVIILNIILHAGYYPEKWRNTVVQEQGSHMASKNFQTGFVGETSL